MNWSKLLRVISESSHCKNSKVAAIIHRDSRIVSTGWNGTPSGFDNDCEEKNITKSLVIHAEANAILFAAKYGMSLKGTTLVCSMSPCIECAKMIVQSGISAVEYKDVYRDDLGLQILKVAKIKTKRI